MKNRSQGVIWVVVVVLIGGLVWASQWLNTSVEKPERVPITPDGVPVQVKEQEKVKKSAKKSAAEFDRVVTLDTTRGTIEFALFENDCPKSTAKIVETVEAGAYDGVKFPRVEDWVIQVDEPKKTVSPIGCEFAHGLSNVAGAVGMARTQDPNSNTNVFYVVKVSQTSLDFNYTVLGFIIKGMDVVDKIQLNDVIKKATLRPSTNADVQLLKKAMKEASSTAS